MNRKRRRICFVITSENQYARSKLLIQELHNRSDIDLKVIVGGSAILMKYGDVLNLMRKDKIPCAAQVVITVEGANPAAMAKTTGLGLLDFVTVFQSMRPDAIVIRGDRYETLSAAIAAAYLNIPVAHIEGGDVTGTIDESVRHAITKLSHIHLTTNEVSKRRVIKMGESPKYVFNVGDPGVEFLAHNKFVVTDSDINRPGVGDRIRLDQPFLMVFQHPVTTEVDKSTQHAAMLLEAVRSFDIQTIWFWPNADAGSDDISREIRRFREHKKADHMRFIKYLAPEHFSALLKQTKCMIGNSSAGIKESSYFGTPTVNVGSRQQGRLRAQNVLDVAYDPLLIRRAIKKQIEHGQYPKSTIYYKKNTSKRAADILAKIPLYVQKRFHD